MARFLNNWIVAPGDVAGKASFFSSRRLGRRRVSLRTEMYQFAHRDVPIVREMTRRKLRENAVVTSVEVCYSWWAIKKCYLTKFGDWTDDVSNWALAQVRVARCIGMQFNFFSAIHLVLSSNP